MAHGDANKSLALAPGEVAQFLNAEGKRWKNQVTPENLVEMICHHRRWNDLSKIAKKVFFVHLAKNGGGAREIRRKAGLVQISGQKS